MAIDKLWSNGLPGDARLIGWERADGARAIETNADPVFDWQDGFDQLWAAEGQLDATTTATLWRYNPEFSIQ
jgi:hypothetical protein